MSQIDPPTRFQARPVCRLYGFLLLLTGLVIGQLCWSPAVMADSLRCGTRLVVTGDSISRLLNACGQPAIKYKAKIQVREGGSNRTTGVTHWVYERGRRKNMVVSVRSGKVVKIARD